MADYALTDTAMIVRTADGAYIPNDEGNRDFQDYQRWLEAGGVPDPYVPPAPTPPAPGADITAPDAMLEAQRANKRLDDGVTAAVPPGLAAFSKYVLEPMPPIGHPVNPAAVHAQVLWLYERTVKIAESYIAMLDAQRKQGKP